MIGNQPEVILGSNIPEAFFTYGSEAFLNGPKKIGM
jgi:hypothetical protein